MMKPMMIYSMPRTQSHAALQAARRTHKLNEPFGFWKLFPQHRSESHNLPAYFNSLITDSQWQDIAQQMAHPHSATKIFGYHIYEVQRSRSWWNDLQAAGTHDMFVIERDRTEVCLSLLMAKVVGFWKTSERPHIPININDSELFMVHRYIDAHLRWFPTQGQLISFDQLPASHFDRSQISMQEQHSMHNLHLIQNLDWCRARIADILDFYRRDWDSCVDRLTAA
jgi:hypothetical protein